MNAVYNQTVYTSEARNSRFHLDLHCRPMRSGQDLWDFDCWDDYCQHRHPRPRRIIEVTLADAFGLGKMPCAYCFPGLASSIYRASSEDDFGHEPHDEYAGSGFAATRIVCRRCIEWFPRQGREDFQLGQSVEWPCTSALILGLVPRTLQETA